MDSVTPPRLMRNGVAALLAAAPLVVLLLGACVWRSLHGDSHAPTADAGGLAVGTRHAAPLSSNELSALNETRFEADRSEAYQAAQKEVRAFLLRRDAQRSARLPAPSTRLPAPSTTRNVTVEKRSPTRFRVRGVVEWRTENNANQPVQSRRFEADLLHGPADDKWRLIDTEVFDKPNTVPAAP